MRCSSCGADNRPGSKFCSECGSPLARTCPNCSTAVSPEAKFCAECGAPLAATGAAVRPRAVPVAPHVDRAAVPDRRLVSVLFADLVGFTPLSEKRDAEEVRELLTRYFDLAGRSSSRYGGVIEKFIGDAVMAVWGAPVAHEDDAERAVRAALDLVEAVPSLGARSVSRPAGPGGRPHRRCAVPSEPTQQGMVAGDLVNTASRFESEAPPGTVLVGESTRSATEAAVVYQDLGEQP